MNKNLSRAELKTAFITARPLFPNGGGYNLDKCSTAELKALANSLGTRTDPEKYHSGVAEVDDDAVLKVASKFHMIYPREVYPNEALEKELGIWSLPTPCFNTAKAIIVMAAAGTSNLKRIYHAIKCIETGAVDTDEIIIAAGVRNVGESENNRVTEAGFVPAATEFELCENAVLELTCVQPERAQDCIPVILGGHELQAQKSEALVEMIVGLNHAKAVKITVIEAPFNPDRLLENGKPATRPNSEETLTAVRSVLNLESEDGDSLYVVSHDVWQRVQMLTTQKIFPGCHIEGSGP